MKESGSFVSLGQKRKKNAQRWARYAPTAFLPHPSPLYRALNGNFAHSVATCLRT